MRILSDSTLLVFGGIYSNLAAFQALQSVADDLKLHPSQVIFTGDCIAYCADAEACARALHAWGCHVVQGNCEAALGNGWDDCGCGFENGTVCDLASRDWFSFAQKQISSEMADWMRSWPRILEFLWFDTRVCVLHGSLRQQNEFVFHSHLKDAPEQFFSDLSADLIFAGHCGVPFVYQWVHQTWVNAGAIGMPANDGTRDGWYALVERANDGFEVQLRRLNYDVMRTVQSMQECKLLAQYQQALQTGLWPSTDVMAAPERLMTGQPLEFSKVLIPQI